MWVNGDRRDRYTDLHLMSTFCAKSVNPMPKQNSARPSKLRLATPLKFESFAAATARKPCLPRSNCHATFGALAFVPPALKYILKPRSAKPRNTAPEHRKTPNPCRGNPEVVQTTPKQESRRRKPKNPKIVSSPPTRKLVVTTCARGDSL